MDSDDPGEEEAMDNQHGSKGSFQSDEKKKTWPILPKIGLSPSLDNTCQIFCFSICVTVDINSLMED